MKKILFILLFLSMTVFPLNRADAAQITINASESTNFTSQFNPNSISNVLVSSFITTTSGTNPRYTYPFIKFDLSQLQNYPSVWIDKVVSAKVKMVFEPNAPNSGIYTNMGLYYINNDGWNSNSHSLSSMPAIEDSNHLGSIPNASVYSDASWLFNTDTIAELNSKTIYEILNSSDKTLSFTFKPDSSVYHTIAFKKSPVELIINTATPVPEPTTMLLGLIGIAGALGLRRKSN